MEDSAAVTPQRVLMISRRFWPHLGSDTACRDRRLVDALRRSGLSVEVLTPRHAVGWNERFEFRESVVHRPLVWPRGPWAARRYQRSLRAWLEDQGTRFGAWVCSGFGEDWSTVLRADVPQVRKFVWHSGTGGGADHVVWGQLHGERRLVAELSQADGVIVSWASVQRALVGVGVEAGRLRRIDIGVASAVGSAETWGSSPVTGGLATLGQSRRALAEINGDLRLEAESLVVMAGGEMTAGGGMGGLAEAFATLPDGWGDLRLWLIGDGPRRGELHDYFRHQSLRPQVAMPGTFTDFEDLYRAADVVVIPSAAEGLEDTLPSAVAAAVPLVVVDSPDTRAFFAGVEGLVGWFRAGMVKGMRDALQDCLLQLVQRREAAKRLRREMLTRRPYQQTVLAFKQLIESSPSSRSPGPSPRSMP